MRGRYPRDDPGRLALEGPKRSSENAAEPLSQYLLELARIEADGDINDDLTIIVLQIESSGRAGLNRILYKFKQDN